MSRLAYKLFVVLVSSMFGAVGSLALYLTRSIIKISANPAGYLIRAKKIAGCYFFGAKPPTREPSSFDPHRYRLSLWTTLLVVLLLFVILMFWIIERGASGW